MSSVTNGHSVPTHQAVVEEGKQSVEEGMQSLRFKERMHEGTSFLSFLEFPQHAILSNKRFSQTSIDEITHSVNTVQDKIASFMEKAFPLVFSLETDNEPDKEIAVEVEAMHLHRTHICNFSAEMRGIRQNIAFLAKSHPDIAEGLRKKLLPLLNDLYKEAACKSLQKVEVSGKRLITTSSEYSDLAAREPEGALSLSQVFHLKKLWKIFSSLFVYAKTVMNVLHPLRENLDFEEFTPKKASSASSSSSSSSSSLSLGSTLSLDAPSERSSPKLEEIERELASFSALAKDIANMSKDKDDIILKIMVCRLESLAKDGTIIREHIGGLMPEDPEGAYKLSVRYRSILNELYNEIAVSSHLKIWQRNKKIADERESLRNGPRDPDGPPSELQPLVKNFIAISDLINQALKQIQQLRK